MDKPQYDALVNSLGANERKMLEATRGLGKATASDLRPVTKSPNTGKPLAYGLTRELQRLEQSGLLRRVGRGTPARYEAVKAAEVEDAAKHYAIRKRRTRRRRSKRARLVELRAYEQGDYSEFYRVHRRVLELTDYVAHHITRMAFWAAAPKEDLARTAQDLADLLDAVDEALTCLKERGDDDALLAKIEKLEATDGRTAPEAASARAIAQKLRAQYEDRLGS
jgi:hypothetical protein